VRGFEPRKKIVGIATRGFMAKEVEGTGHVAAYEKVFAYMRNEGVGLERENQTYENYNHFCVIKFRLGDFDGFGI